MLVIDKSDSRFCLSLVWLQTESDSTRSYYYYKLESTTSYYYVLL